MRLHIVLFDGFDELDAIAPYETLRSVAMMDDPRAADLHIELVALDGPRDITAAHGLTVRATGRLDPAAPPDLLLIPGGGWQTAAPHSVRAEVERGALPQAIARAHANGATIAAVCTGAMLLAAAGLTTGRPATTHHTALADLHASGAILTAARVVDDGDLITAGGVTSGLDLALWLIERYLTPQLALDAERRLEYERRGVVWRRPTPPSHPSSQPSEA